MTDVNITTTNTKHSTVIQPVWQAYWDHVITHYSGIKVADRLTEEMLYKPIWAYEVATKSKFIKGWKTGNSNSKSKFSDSGTADIQKIKKCKILWNPDQTKIWLSEESTGHADSVCDGSWMPFVSLGTKTYICHQGYDQNAAKKRKQAESLENGSSDHAYSGKLKRRNRIQCTKKRDCPAKCHMRHVVCFPEFKIDKNTKAKRRLSSEKIRIKLREDEPVKMEHRVIYQLANPDQHQNHLSGEGAGVRQPVDPRIIKKIHELADGGVNQVSEMIRHLNIYVKSELFWGEQPPDMLDRRFHPTKQDLHSHIYRAKVRRRLAKVDQENLQAHLDIWKQEDPEAYFHFRPRSKVDPHIVPNDEDEYDFTCVSATSSETTFLLCHQTAFQRALLNRYGDEICLLDATYKTIKYPLPLFFICLPTNVSYQVVGWFVTQYERQSAIEEALEIFKNWNPSWKPTCFMTDFCHKEIAALETVFPNSTVLLWDFHCIKAWDTWCKISDNGVAAVKEGVLSKLRKVADSSTEEQYKDAVADLEGSHLWKNYEKLRKWFLRTWIPEHKRWVRAFRKDHFHVSINTNNGIEQQNRILKHNHLKDSVDKTITGLASVIIHQFLPESYKGYVQKNAQALGGYSSYSKDLPPFLHDRPRMFLEHVHGRYLSAEAIPKTHIKVLTDTTFHVKSFEEKEGTVFKVDFGNSETMPFCSCNDWGKYHLPCKHFCAIFHHYPEMGWDMLSPLYRDNVYFCVDLQNCKILGYKPVYMNDGDVDNEVSQDGDVSISTKPFDSPEKGTEHCVPLTGKTLTLKNRMAGRCRDILQNLKDLTYRVKDGQKMKYLLGNLETLFEETKGFVETDSGLVLEEQVPVGVKRKMKGRADKDLVKKKPKLLPLPSDQKRRHPASGRFGNRANMPKQMYEDKAIPSSTTSFPPVMPTKCGTSSIPVKCRPTSTSIPPVVRPTTFIPPVVGATTSSIPVLSKLDKKPNDDDNDCAVTTN